MDFFPHNIALTPETTSQQIARKLDEVIKLCTNIPDKFSKPADRSAKLLAELLPTKNMQTTKAYLPPKPTITSEKHIGHKYNTRSTPQTHNSPPRVNARLPRVPVAAQHVTNATKYNYVAMNTMAIANVPQSLNTETIGITMEQEAQWLAHAVLDENGNVLEYRHLMKRPEEKQKWEGGMCRELGRLCNRHRKIKGTNTMKFIAKHQVPQGRRITYMRIVCDHKPHKSDPIRVRLCVGGDRLEFDGPLRTPTADLTTVKVHINSTISTPGSRYMTGDIKNFYLGTPLKIYEYAKIHRKNIPQEYIDAHKLEPLFDNQGFIYVEIQKGMYGLKQAGKIANDQLKSFLLPHGYRTTYTPGLWTHKTKPISFTLIVDDFGVKYTDRKDAQDLMDILDKKYEAVTTDWTGTLYSGISLKWDYKKKKVHLSMPGYALRSLGQFQHPLPDDFTMSAHPYVVPVYGQKVQLAQQESTAPKLSEQETL